MIGQIADGTIRLNHEINIVYLQTADEHVDLKLDTALYSICTCRLTVWTSELGTIGTDTSFIISINHEGQQGIQDMTEDIAVEPVTCSSAITVQPDKLLQAIGSINTADTMVPRSRFHGLGGFTFQVEDA